MLDRAVVNAGPLVALSLLDQLDLLPALFAECWVPQTVFNEVAVAGIGKPGAKSLQGVDWQARVRVSPIPDPLLVMELDAGEAEVISLARQLSPCVSIIDERRGLISGVRPCLLELRAAGYFISDSVIAAACQAVGE